MAERCRIGQWERTRRKLCGGEGKHCLSLALEAAATGRFSVRDAMRSKGWELGNASG